MTAFNLLVFFSKLNLPPVANTKLVQPPKINQTIQTSVNLRIFINSDVKMHLLQITEITDQRNVAVRY